MNSDIIRKGRVLSIKFFESKPSQLIENLVKRYEEDYLDQNYAIQRIIHQQLKENVESKLKKIEPYLAISEKCKISAKFSLYRKKCRYEAMMLILFF